MVMKVLLVDDHVLFREGISMLLKHLMGAVEVFEAGSCREGMSQLASQPGMDLILMDIGLPDMSGIEGIGLIREQYPDVPVVALSSSEDKATVLSALDKGAMGFIPKTSSSAVLTSALRLIMAHGIYLPPSVFLSDRHEVAAERARPTPTGIAQQTTPATLGLTPRQAEVLHRILQGKPSKVICRELELSSSTVKTHTSAVLRALNVTTRTQAVVAAGKLGLRF
jgi:DNA-binding NarL/FixJ family response regulator